MQQGQASRTALVAATHRAAHQTLDRGFIFRDPLATRIVDTESLAAYDDSRSARRMRIFIAARTRIAEDALATAVERDARQLVILGAGLDTFAYRTTLLDRLRIFEVDHPATQAWKRKRLHNAAIDVPASLTYVGIDFERETLADALTHAGFDAHATTFFTWLGVVPYLTDAATFSTLAYIASLHAGAHVVFDYANPADELPPALRVLHERRAAHVAALGESFVNAYSTPTLHERLRALGFTTIEDWGPRDIAARYFPDRLAAVPASGGHILHAVTR